MTNFTLRLKPQSPEHRGFERAFGIDLSDHVDALTGLDVIEVDELMGTPEGTSTGQYIEQKTDAATVAYVKSLFQRSPR